MLYCDAEHMPKMQYENVKKAQAEAQARQQAEAGQQPKFYQQQQASACLLGLAYRKRLTPDRATAPDCFVAGRQRVSGKPYRISEVIWRYDSAYLFAIYVGHLVTLPLPAVIKLA